MNTRTFKFIILFNYKNNKQPSLGHRVIHATVSRNTEPRINKDIRTNVIVLPTSCKSCAFWNNGRIEYILMKLTSWKGICVKPPARKVLPEYSDDAAVRWCGGGVRRGVGRVGVGNPTSPALSCYLPLICQYLLHVALAQKAFYRIRCQSN